MKVERLPRTGETVLGTGYRVDHGGKGSNQAVGCARLGASVCFVARIGNDDFGEMALSLHREEGLDVAHIRKMDSAPTGVGFIVVDAASGNNIIAIDPGANGLLTPREIHQCEAALHSSSVVLTQLEIPLEAAETALKLGRARGALTILNPAPVRPLSSAILEMVDVLTPNETEAKVLLGRRPDDPLEPEAVARELIGRGVKQVIVTLGERGALIVTPSSSTHIPAIQVLAVDTTGAGDSFNAGLAVALACGTNLEDAVRFAVVTGGLAVTQEGVIPSLPRREHVLQYFQQSRLTPPDWFSQKWTSKD